MQKWEYCAIVGIKRDDLDFRGYHPRIWRFIGNGIEITRIDENTVSEDTTELAKSIAQLGEQGWEMVGVGHSNHHDENILYFKRPIG